MSSVYQSVGFGAMMDDQNTHCITWVNLKLNKEDSFYDKGTLG